MVHVTAYYNSVLLLFVFIIRTGDANSVNQFALDLYRALPKSSENTLVSPLSLQIVLAMTMQGAKGITEVEMKNVLHHNTDNRILLEDYEVLISELQNSNLKLASKMFTEKTSEIYPGFQSILRRYFSSEVQGLDFRRNPEVSRKEINDWVEQNTNHKIKDLFLRDSLGYQTKLVLVNAVYFKDKWVHQFDIASTRDEPFHVETGRTVTVKMMKLTEKKLNHLYSGKLGAEIIELPFQRKEFKMIIILPYEKNSLANVESNLESSDIFQELNRLQTKEIFVHLPRFKLVETMDMKNILQKMGMRTAFRDHANFTGITKGNIKIDQVLQKTFVEVNEEGATAAAGSGDSFVLVSLPPQVYCNRPFMFMIMKGKTILLLGRFSNPEAQAKDDYLSDHFVYPD